MSITVTIGGNVPTFSFSGDTTGEVADAIRSALKLTHPDYAELPIVELGIVANKLVSGKANVANALVSQPTEDDSPGVSVEEEGEPEPLEGDAYVELALKKAKTLADLKAVREELVAQGNWEEYKSAVSARRKELGL